MKIDQYCQLQRCKHVELEQFLAGFRVARVCQRQLGFLVFLSMRKCESNEMLAFYWNSIHVSETPSLYSVLGLAVTLLFRPHLFTFIGHCMVAGLSLQHWSHKSRMLLSSCNTTDDLQECHEHIDVTVTQKLSHILAKTDRTTYCHSQWRK